MGGGDQIRSGVGNGAADVAVGHDYDRRFLTSGDVTIARDLAAPEPIGSQPRLAQNVAEHTAALLAANLKLAAANEELERFAYSVSHDLRAPLRTIDGFSRILLEDCADKLDAEGRRLLNVVRDNTVKINRLIDALLAFSRVGRMEMAAAPVDMTALVRRVLAEELAPAVAGRRLAIDIRPLLAARGDEILLRQVWLNLLDNALKFTAPKPDARIEIDADAGAGETIYRVRDNGVGFDMRYVGKLFKAFERLHGSDFAGTGVGLAIVKRIVERHGGRVWAESSSGEGAAFFFALPSRGVRR